MRLACSLSILVALCLATFSPVQAQDAPAKKARVLMLTQSKGFQHGSVRRKDGQLSASEQSMTQLGQQSGLFEIHCTQDAAADFTKDNLKNYDLVMLYTTGDLPIADADKDYFFKEWLTQKGHGVVGFHSATDTFHNYDPYWDMIGGTFNGHPWGSGETVTLSIDDPKFPGMDSLGSEFKIRDEIYQYKNWQPAKVRVLASLDMANCKTKKPYMVPVAWAKNYGQGRVFYTNLGHNEETWANKAFLGHVTGGIKWVLGLVEGDATPNPELQAQLEEKAKQAAEGAQ